MSEPTISMTPENRSTNTCLDIKWVPVEPKKAPAMPKRENISAALVSTFPRRQWMRAPNRLVAPTMAIDIPTASLAGTCAMYTSTGRVTMEPPLPRTPRETPISAASAIARTELKITDTYPVVRDTGFEIQTRDMVLLQSASHTIPVGTWARDINYLCRVTCHSTKMSAIPNA